MLTPHLLLLPHDLQLLGQLDLALALCLLCCAPQLLPVLLPQRVQSPTRVPDLGQLVLQAFVVHCGGKGSLRDPLEHSDCPCTLLWLLSRQAVPRECQTLALGGALAAAGPSPGPPAAPLPRTPALIQLVEQLQQLGVHVVDGLEEGQHGRVVGDAAASHVVALHAVDKRGDRVLQSLQELLVVLLRLAVLVLLLEGQGGRSRTSRAESQQQPHRAVPGHADRSGAAQPCGLQARPRPPLTSTTPSGVGWASPG